MADVFYPGTLAADPGTVGRSPLPNAVFQVFELADTAQVNPLPLKDSSGLSITSLASTSLGVLPPVYVTSPNLSHNWVSGTWVWRRDSFDGAQAAVTAAKNASISGASLSPAGDLSFTTLGGTVIPAGNVKGPQGSPGSNTVPTDTAIKNVVTDPASQTAGALNATYGPAAAAMKAAFAQRERRRDTRVPERNDVKPFTVSGKLGDTNKSITRTYGSNTTISAEELNSNVVVGAGVVVTVLRGVLPVIENLHVDGELRFERYPGGDSTGTSQGTGPGAVGIGAGGLMGMAQPGGQTGALGTTGAGSAGGSSAAKTTEGGTGGNGGAGGSSGATTGGNGGTAGARTLPIARVRNSETALLAYLSTAGSSAVGGAAGGSGAGDGTNAGGGGGGGGTAGAFAKLTIGKLSGSGSITANGGAGGKGGNAAGGNAAGGGGGGGGGGGQLVVEVADRSGWTGTMTASGGVGGAAGTSSGTGGAATAGANGGDGFVLVLDLKSQSVGSRPIIAVGADNASPLTAGAIVTDAGSAPVAYSNPTEAYVSGGVTFRRSSLQTGNSGFAGPRNGGAPMVVRWTCDHPVFEFGILPLNGRWRLRGDGEWLHDWQQAIFTTGQRRWVQVDYNRFRAVREFELWLDETPFGGLAMVDTGMVTATERRFQHPLGILGDSRAESNLSLPTIGEQNRMEGISYSLARELGYADTLNDAEGGTGFFNNGGGGGRKVFAQRIVDDFGPLSDSMKPDTLFILGGYNDGLATTVQLQQAVADTFAAARTWLPNCAIVPVFMPDRAAPAINATNQPSMMAILKAATLAEPNCLGFIDMISGSVTPGPLCTVPASTAPATPFLTTGNQATMIGSDAVHYTLYGYKAAAKWVAAKYRSLLPA